MSGGHDAAEYGSHIAGQYDEIYGGVHDTAGAVAVIAELAGGGAVLELGVGTGRLALPLARLGLAVCGVDGSPAMLDALAAQPDGSLVETVVGDFAEVSLGRRFSVVVLAVNTIYALPDQAAQVRCFANAARHLEPGGRFVVDAWVPNAAVLESPLSPRRLAPGHVGLVVAEHDPVRQRLLTTQVVIGGSAGIRVFPVNHRYAYPPELDLMAQLAGMNLEHRWADWARAPFTRHSTDHVSVYRRT
jgi:SAM-dependent methyltransferase